MAIKEPIKVENIVNLMLAEFQRRGLGGSEVWTNEIPADFNQAHPKVATFILNSIFRKTLICFEQKTNISTLDPRTYLIEEDLLDIWFDKTFKIVIVPFFQQNNVMSILKNG